VKAFQTEEGPPAIRIMLPEDQKDDRWVVRVTGENRGVLSAVSEDGSPLDDALNWDMTRER